MDRWVWLFDEPRIGNGVRVGLQTYFADIIPQSPIEPLGQLFDSAGIASPYRGEIHSFEGI